ncbi:MAG: LysM peptidoglycan-binding domain-containing protein [Woeseiaceae bacterium]|nr:LysM peptidoglycan-binding domain-containing protein [Woeseiaceae bacterium]
MSYSFSRRTRQLLQRFQAFGAACVTFFVLLGPATAAEPVLTLYSPVAGFDLPSTPTGPDDIIEALRRGFELTYDDNQRTAAELRWYKKHPDYLNRVFTRAQRYLPYIVAELERRDMPLELALLPIVESAFDPFAYSHGRAAGLWQMIPGTAKRFGIKQNWWYDGRRDIVDSTRAALDYLEYLHELNDGDWLNAIASYNSGEGNVLRAARNNRKKGKPVDFWNLKLPRETSMYVPKLLALVEIVADPGQHNLTLPVVVDEPQFVVTDIGGQLDLALAAELAGVDVDTIYRFNPGYNRWSTDPAGPHQLVLPIDVAETFVSALGEVPQRERVRWKRHKVESGEAISQIAEKYSTTVSALRAANNLRGNTIRAGHHLMIPVATKPLSAYSQSADARLAKKQNRKRPGSKVEHVVSSGESFWTIAQRYKVTHRQLAAWNGMAPGDTLSVGKKLVVWTKAGSDSPATSPLTTGSTKRKLRYTVRNGDSLYIIARKFRVGIDQIARWNGLDKNKILRPGQKLTLHVDVTAQSS